MAHLERGKVLELAQQWTHGHMAVLIGQEYSLLPALTPMVPILCPPRSENLGANGV